MGKHSITAIVRHSSEHQYSDNVNVVRVDYDDHETLVSALRGQEILIITLAIVAPQDAERKLVQAAAEAKVPYIMPNVWGVIDIKNEAILRELPGAGTVVSRLENIQKLGASYIVMTCGYWYGWSLAMGEPGFGFDLRTRTVTFFDDGNTKINVSTWKQCGRGLAALLSLPESSSSPALSQWKNQTVYIASFKVSQRDILDSIHRVNGTTDDDWTIKHQDSSARFKAGLQELKKGEMTGFARARYARIFFPTGDGDYETSRGLDNETLRLPREDLDESTREVLGMVEKGWNPWTS